MSCEKGGRSLMSSKAKKSQAPAAPPRARKSSSKPSKKDQIVSLFLSGLGEVEDVAVITGARPSYVASVLQEAGLHSGYFDLYTSTSQPQNIYSKFFAGKLGFKDGEAALDLEEASGENTDEEGGAGDPETIP